MGATVVPPVGTRYRISHGKGFATVVEYIGPNPDKEFETADAHLIRTVEAFPGGAPVGNEVAIDVLWFGTHEHMRVRS